MACVHDLGCVAAHGVCPWCMCWGMLGCVWWCVEVCWSVLGCVGMCWGVSGCVRVFEKVFGGVGVC